MIHEILQRPILVIDVESVGLHGEAFAVAGFMVRDDGSAFQFIHACPAELCEQGIVGDLEWVQKNVSIVPESIRCKTPSEVRIRFWNEWRMLQKEQPEILMAADCLWPVEARFLAACVDDSRESRNWKGPYPLIDISAVMASAGVDPMANHPRTSMETPAHNPLADARQSHRLLQKALRILNH